MIEIQLSARTLTKPIVTFHANTIGFFYSTSNELYGFHVGHIKSIDITEKKDKNFLVVVTEAHTVSEEIDPAVLPRVKKMLAEVRQAMQDFRS